MERQKRHQDDLWKRNKQDKIKCIVDEVRKGWKKNIKDFSKYKVYNLNSNTDINHYLGIIPISLHYIPVACNVLSSLIFPLHDICRAYPLYLSITYYLLPKYPLSRI